MPGLEVWFRDVLPSRIPFPAEDPALIVAGGLFLDSSVPNSLVSSISVANPAASAVRLVASRPKHFVLGLFRWGRADGVGFLSVKKNKFRAQGAGAGAMNTIKHLWAGAGAAMVSRTFVAPLERLKLEYIVRGEQMNLFALIHKIGTTQGLKGFWKGNFVNILRTAPFKAVNFYAYDTYGKQLLKMSGNEETTNFERFLAGAAAGITATILCLPMDTIRTKMLAPGGEALGGVICVFRHMVQTEGFFSLYKGLVPALISMAPSGAVFYGVYDILKSAYLHSPEGKRRISLMKQQQGKDVNALDQLEVGPMRTLLYGAIAGACAQAATYPFEVVRRQLQMQVQATKLNAFATSVKIVEQGGIPALYAGLIPSLLQVLPSAAISYFVYAFMKIVLEVE
ncbi:probable mitochondrial adenine nucleotide transporter BTL3 [Phoenix dactylifera]|uniref:Probable mitochondrial adenine nucleotide transporter BTL3 n=1 Tax=Phoenix dactylifera TaxID=42345 RepID=A0A8B9AI27_PHODC|nr:probable mitochondrial adenine nucleotide transporter BTL3 [Phoenix dactylifera]XP_026658285.2 probable mitochondrial adenine nucleotide transporter BTL3 [Phoenix dactylifera]XP_038985959.1 probable mitochondrial adenine nucleotide transporter BTL3 [Phoenix dactylifera]XP_038985960.1 probable mitochondrial adenine nucleotide transporter BTL3 [Phoenix dactylifera]XP_038985961.1 probable mitochondrial adenine nucleotide transporter BTL3 [Phoenix dactylifera]